MAWGSATTGSAVTLTTSYQSLGTITTTAATDVVDLQIVAAFQSSPASNINFEIYSSPDGTNFDTKAITGALISNANGLSQSVSVPGLQGAVAYKVEAALDASGDSSDTAQIRYAIG